MEKYRSRKFCLLLYPLEDETHNKALEYIKLNYDYALIVHDKDKNELQMNILHNLYEFSIKVTKETALEENKDIKFKIFSDNIIIAKKVSEDKEQRVKDIRSLLLCAGHFQDCAASSSVGWMLRGGITIGQFFIDDVMVWGSALVKAYYLEDKVAVYPRIVIDNSIVQEIESEEALKEFLRKDFDNLYFLNFLNYSHFRGRYLKEGFEMMKIGRASCRERV